MNVNYSSSHTKGKLQLKHICELKEMTVFFKWKQLWHPNETSQEKSSNSSNSELVQTTNDKSCIHTTTQLDVSMLFQDQIKQKCRCWS